MYYGQYNSGLYNEPFNLKLNLTYEQTQDSVLQNIHCHDVMLSFAKNAHYIPPHLILLKYPANLDKYLIIGFYGK